MLKIAVIDDNGSAREELLALLSAKGEVDCFHSEAEFLQSTKAGSYQCVFAESNVARKLQGLLLGADAATPVIHLASQPSITEAVAAIKLGAVDYLARPITADDLERALEAALRQQRTGVPDRYFADGAGLESQLDNMERELICNALWRASGVVGGRAGAAKLLGVTRTGLLYKMRRLNISRVPIAPSEAAPSESECEGRTQVVGSVS